MGNHLNRLQRRLARSRNPGSTRSVGRPSEPTRSALAEALGYPAQAKLKVGAPDDVHEREADAVAERVMATPDSALQRKPADGGAATDATSAAAGGRSLPPDERAFFEPRLGADLGRVR